MENTMHSIQDALSRLDMLTAKSLIKPALGSDDQQITRLHILVAPTGDPVKDKGRSGLSDAQALDFLRQLDIDGSEMMKVVLRDPNCFTPNSGSYSYGHFWSLGRSRPYIRLLVGISTLAAWTGDYQLAYDTDLRILSYNQDDNTGTRTSFCALQTKLDRDLEAYNYCITMLEAFADWGKHCGKYEGKDFPKMMFDKYKKEDIDPNDVTIYAGFTGYGEDALLFTGALALFKLFGPCPKADAWLAAGHARNSHILPILIHPDSPSYPTSRFRCPRSDRGFIDASDFVFFTHRQFCSPQIQAWLRSAGQDLEKRKCSYVGCEKIEGYMGEWRRCTGCFEAYYCSQECQAKHWRTAGNEGHKADCQYAQRTMASE